MEVVTGPVPIGQILRERNNWRRYLAWKGDELDPWTRQVVSKALACRTAALGCHLFLCEDCQIVRLVPHSCKTSFCSSCGAARTDAWCRQLLTDLLEVPYRHLIFTLPRELRHLIRVNKEVLLNALYRAGSRALLSLTAGRPEPLPGINRQSMAARRRRFLPGFLIVCHTFASDLKFNPHLHVLVTAGGLSLDRRSWMEGPGRSLVRSQELAREWKKNVINEIRKAEEQGLLYHPPFGGDPNNPTKVEALLTCVAKKRWWIHIGPSLEQVDRTLRYACRYTRRPAIGEMRILRYDGTDVDFLYTDYADSERKKVMRRSALYFIHRLVQHIPPKHFVQVRYYGLLATANRGKLLPLARRRLGQRKRRRRQQDTWHSRRLAHGISNPLACPQCGQTMRDYGLLFGCPESIAEIAAVALHERLPPDCCAPLSRLERLSRTA